MILQSCGLNPTAVFAEVDSGRPLATIKKEHTRYARTHEVWGVPVFVVGDHAVFVRLLDRAEGDEALAQHTIEKILDLIEWPILNEFKHTSVPR
jgi:2-hydroxychromene-2-carboxylate isomerase